MMTAHYPHHLEIGWDEDEPESETVTAASSIPTQSNAYGMEAQFSQAKISKLFAALLCKIQVIQ